jgi:Uma2 family endonuclease
MSTTGRHTRLSGTLFGRIVNLLEKKEVYALQEGNALVHWGQKNKNDLLSLVDISDIDNKEIDDFNEFIKSTINELDYVQPDFFLFKDNKYLYNENETKVAGYPDLIVEVWSRDNSKFHRKQKMDLYATSDITEHWYIKQDSNIVECYYGKEKLKNQSLKNILKTQNGLEFDLRYLAIYNEIKKK